jgi:hypothetical protein
MGTGQYADVTWFSLYHDTHDSGRPLRGGLGCGKMLGPILPALAYGQQVIGVAPSTVKRP